MTSFYKRFLLKIFLPLLPFLFLSAAACNKPAAQSKTLTAVVKGEVESLDPVLSYDGVTHGLLLNVYDTLIRFKGSSLREFEPSLAKRVPTRENGLISEDGKTYKFEIRDDIKFTDGTPLTAEDVLYSLRRFLISDTAGGPSSLLLAPLLDVNSTRDDNGNIIITYQDIERAVSREGNTIVITLNKPFAPLLGILARWSYVLSKNFAVKGGEWDGSEQNWQKFNNRQKADSYLFDKALGSGPFSVRRWDIAGKKVYLAANKNYFRGAPKLDGVQMFSIAEQSTMRLMLESADADIAEISGSFAEQIAGNPSVAVEDALPRLKTDPVIFFTFDINSEGNPDIGSGRLDGQGIPPDFFKDVNIRKAFAYSFDYDAFVNQSMKGKAPRAIGPVPPALLDYGANPPKYDFDLDKARQYFKQAYGGEVWDKGFSFTLTYNTGSDLRQTAAEILKRNVENLNPKFKIELRGVPWASFLEKTQARKMPMWLRGWIADYPDAHNFAFPFLDSEGRYALAQGFKDERLDKLIKQASAETDAKARQDLYRQIHALSFEDVPQIYTVHSPGVWVFRKEVKGFVDNPVFMGLYFYPMYK